jgi:type II secretory pathway component PulF
MNDDLTSLILLVLTKVFVAVSATIIWLAVIAGGIYLIHFLFSLPMRRAERARLFLELVEDALKRGQGIEAMILSVAQSRDLALGIKFYLLAAHIENGLKFSEALKKVPRFLPPQISAILLVGEKLGDLKGVLPACREILCDRPAGTRSAIHYLILVLLFFSPSYICVIILTTTFVVPKFKDVAAGMGIHLLPLTVFVFGATNWLIVFEIFLSLMMAAAVMFYVGGPNFARWFQFRGLPVVDWIAWRVPWKRKRLQRTFSAMLAVLLDGGVPEGESVRLAGESTANEICRRRAHRVVAALEQGEKLDDAVRHFDNAGEFHWRLSNAVHARGGFLNGLRGWHAALEAKAFQQEEATAHAVTSGVVILNGFVVALIAIAMFGMLVMILRGVLDAS